MRSIRKIALMAVGDSAWQGGIQYIVNIINALNTVSFEKRLEVHLFRHPHQKFIDLKQFDKIDLFIHHIDEVLQPWTVWNRLKWFLQRKFEKRIYPRLENYLLANQFDYVYPATLSDCNGKLNVGSWIADFQYRNFPQGHNAETTQMAEKTIRTIATVMRKVVFSSNACEQEGFQIYPQLRGKSHVMPFSVYIDQSTFSKVFLQQIRAKYNLREPFLMVSNLFAATKNHKTLFEALGILRHKGVIIKLVCTGNIINHTDLDFANNILQMLTENQLHEQVKLLGMVPRPDQLALYRMAFALVQPSRHEGWSTFVEEAKALGKTLICSDIPVHREQWPNGPLFFDATNAEALATTIHQINENHSISGFPDEEVEQIAIKRYQLSVRAFGEQFLGIASA